MSSTPSYTFQAPTLGSTCRISVYSWWCYQWPVNLYQQTNWPSSISCPWFEACTWPMSTLAGSLISLTDTLASANMRVSWTGARWQQRRDQLTLAGLCLLCRHLVYWTCWISSRRYWPNWLWYLQYSAVKGVLSLSLTTYFCSSSLDGGPLLLAYQGQLVFAVSTSGSRSSPLPSTVCSWMFSFFAVQISLSERLKLRTLLPCV